MLTPKDEAFLQVAKDLGHLTSDQVEESRAAFETVSAAGVKVTLAKLLQDQGRLSQENLNQIAAELRARGIHPNIGPYDVLTRLGTGGSATVYKAADPRNKRVVALKVLAPSLAADAKSVQRFIRGAELAAKVKHKNVAETYEVAREGTRYYIAMEVVQGTPLSEMAQEGNPLEEAQALHLIQQVADALATCHAQGIVHRDVKPSNVMLEPLIGVRTADQPKDRPQRAILTDFGIAKLLDEGTQATRAGIYGTADYMAPEQIRLGAAVDGRADIYALGVMLYRLLTGRMPFLASSPNMVMMAHLEAPPPDARDVLPDLPEHAARALQRAMAKDPADRFATAAELLTQMR
jgi:eukaryotic-like serine/threonine-protein kinase